jgi:hypothetical protein
MRADLRSDMYSGDVSWLGCEAFSGIPGRILFPDEPEIFCVSAFDRLLCACSATSTVTYKNLVSVGAGVIT